MAYLQGFCFLSSTKINLGKANMWLSMNGSFCDRKVRETQLIYRAAENFMQVDASIPRHCTKKFLFTNSIWTSVVTVCTIQFTLTLSQIANLDAVNWASTNHPFTNWRSKKHEKTELGWRTSIKRSSGAPFYHGRLLFLCGCCTRLEQFAFRHYLGHVTVGFQTGVEDRAVLSQLFW